jgi:hypothetical protein
MHIVLTSVDAIFVVFQKMFNKVARQLKEYRDANDVVRKTIGHWSFSSTPDMLNQETIDKINKYQSESLYHIIFEYFKRK